MQSPQAPRGPDAHPDLHVLDVGGREFVVVGTAHISRESADLVREVIERERPDRVCLELDRQRYEALANPQRWDALDVKQLIRDRQLAALVANLMLAAYQKKLGGALGVKPGAELLEAARAAEALGIPVSLCDRDVRVTLRRAWASLSLWKKSMLVSTFLASSLEKPEISEEDLRELRQQDVVSRMMAELAEFLPALKRVLIDERDAYLAQRMREAPGRRVVAVVGAGHVAGLLAALRGPGTVDLTQLDRIPPVSPVTRWLGWGIPASIVAALVAVGVTQGLEAAARDLAFWVLVTGIPCTLGAAAAFAHPITIAAAFFTAPVTTLSPVIGAGHVLALVQAWVQPPLVSEFERLAEDFTRPLQWWRNRLLRVLLVFILTTLGTMLGVYVGGWEIVSKLFGGGGA
jgi:pheromone shutdown-related protein TraB